MNENAVAAEERKKAEQELTPEEKLFRLIAASNQDDSELQELLARFSKPVKAAWGRDFVKGWRTAELLPPAMMRAVILVALGAVAFYFLSGIRTGRTFYLSPGARLGEVGIEHAVDFFPNFFVQKESWPPAMNAAPPGGFRTSASSLPGAQTSSVVIPAPVVSPYRLVGISWDEKGPVAMVESGQDPRARFVRKGEMLPGNVRVEEIKNYTIVLASRFQKWEIS